MIPIKLRWKRQLYIVDFGLANAYNDYGNDYSFVGTSLYASLSAHHGKRVRRIDDLWSLFYLIIDISTNQLPWKDDYVMLDHKQRRNKIAKQKAEFEREGGIPSHLPKEYAFIASLLKQATLKCGENEDIIDENLYENVIRLLKDIFKNDSYSMQQNSLDLIEDVYVIMLCVQFLASMPFIFSVFVFFAKQMKQTQTNTTKQTNK